MSRSSLTAAGLVLLLVTAVTPAAQPASVETLLGIVDERGLLTPVVSFDGVQWRNRWPGPDQKIADMTLPSSLAAIPRAWTGFPVPARWHAWPVGAAAIRPIQVKGPTRYDASCVPGIALQSDLPPPPRRTAENSWPKKKTALAVSNEAVRVEPIDKLKVIGDNYKHFTVRPDTLADRNLLSAAEAPFRVLARKALATDGIAVKLPPKAVRWTSAWRYTLADLNEQVYLLHGQIDHEDWRGALTGFLWLKVRNGVVGEHRGHAVMDDEDYKRTVNHLPLGVVRIGGHHFWVSAQRGYESEAYQLIDLTSATLAEVLVADGGGC